MKQIQKKFIVIILSGVLLSAMIIGSMAVYFFQKMTTEDSKKVIQLTCDKNANKLNGMLERIEQSVEVMKVHSMAGFDKVEQLQDESFYTGYIDDLKKLGKNIADNTQGAIGVYYRLAPEIAGNTAGFFWSKLQGSQEFYDLEVTDFSLYDPDDLEHVGWYYIPVENGGPTWMLPYMNLNNNIYMISYVIPLYKQDTLIGVVGIDIDFNLITDMVSQIKVYDSGYAFLTDREGNVLYNQYPDEKGKNRAAGTAFTSMVNNMRLVITAPEREIFRERNQMIGFFVTAAVVISLFFVLVVIRNIKAVVAFAYCDVLTGARNKNAYQEAVNRFEEKIHFGNTSFAVIVFDINNLKKVNDTFGHLVGDKMIIEGYNRIKRVFRKAPVYRIGGDEFVVLLDKYSKEDCEQLIREFKMANEKKNNSQEKEEEKVHIASGFAVYQKEEDRSFLEVFNRADQAMYANKSEMKSGRTQ